MTNKSKIRVLKETVFFESLAFKIVYFPFRIFWSIIHSFDALRLRLWRIKNVDIPYKGRRNK